MGNARPVMASVLVLDYGLARSERIVQALAHIGVEARVTSSLPDVRTAERLLLPDGDDGERSLERGMNRDVIVAVAEHIAQKRPLLAVGLGAMFLCEGSTHPDMPIGARYFEAPVQRFDPRMTDELERPLKSPHTGFAYVVGLDRHPMLAKAVQCGEQGVWLYFRHRLCAPARVPFSDVAVAHHGVPFAGAIWRDEVLALQFLPELSGPLGLEILRAWATGGAP